MTLIVETHLRVLREIVESLATHGLYQTMALAHGPNVTACNYPQGLASGILSSAAELSWPLTALFPVNVPATLSPGKTSNDTSNHV